MADGRLPDLGTIQRRLDEFGVGASLRGAEATVDGSVVQTDGRLFLIASGTGERMALAPLGRKVQWDIKAKREQAMTEPERTAYARLRASLRSRRSAIQVIGPVKAGGKEKGHTLEVREFHWK
jgi:hypothetical protein